MYWKRITEGKYIVAVGVSEQPMYEEIPRSEYEDLLHLIEQAPVCPDGFGCRLKSDGTWDLYELPNPPYVPTAEDKAEAYDILMGVGE